MKFTNIRTDLAAEMQEAVGLSEKDGVSEENDERNGIKVRRTHIKSDRAAEALGKPVGNYVTVDCSGAFSDDEKYTAAIEAVADELHTLVGTDISQRVLIVGLGNVRLTSDSIGPHTLDGIIVTRHIRTHLPDLFSAMPLREVCAIAPGVLGRTGIESGDIVRAVTEKTSPSAVIVIDSLAARDPARICTAVQMSDTGIAPGSGIGNTRAEITQRTLGVPVIAVGVPTVVSSVTLSADMFSRLLEKLEHTSPAAHRKLSDALGDGDISDLICENLSPRERSMIVTPSDIDGLAAKISRLLSAALNKALHGALEQEEINALLNT